MAIKKGGKKYNSCNNYVDETSFVVSKATGGRTGSEGIVHVQQKMLYI